MEEQAPIIYHETFTVEQFKDAHKDSKLTVVKNPKTGKLFFTCGDVKAGAVSKNITADSNVVVSDVTITETGERLFMLHNQASNNVVMTF